MPHLTGVVRVEDADGNRVDQPDGKGVFSPIVLQLDSTLVGTATPNGNTTRVTLSAPGANAALIVASVAALKALHAADFLDGQIVTVKNEPDPFKWSSTTGAGFVGDDNTTVQLTETLTGNAGRFYRMASAPIVDTIAALAAAVAGQHKRVHVRSYAALDDGGAGIFDDVTAISSAPHDGGIVIHAGARIFKRRYDARINVKWWGARGDGITNDTPPIQAAIAWAYNARVNIPFGTDFVGGYPSAVVGTRIWFPQGAYNLHRATPNKGTRGYRHALEVPAGIHLEGEQGAAFMTTDATANARATGFAAVRWQQFENHCSGIMFKGFYAGILIAGVTVNYAYFLPASGVEHPCYVSHNQFLGCKFAVLHDFGPTALVAAASDGASVTTGTIHVTDGDGGTADDTQLFLDVPGSLSIKTTNGFELVNYTEKTASTFTGCTSAGSGTLHTDQPVVSGIYRGFQSALIFENNRVVGPHCFRGIGDDVQIRHNMLAIDVTNFTPEVGANGLPLGFFESGDHLKLIDNLYEVEGTFAGSPAASDRACIVNACGDVHWMGGIHFDAQLVMIRNRIFDAQFAGLGVAPLALSVEPTQQIAVYVHGSVWNSVERYWLELFDNAPRAVRVYGNDPTNLTLSRGIFMCSDTLNLTNILKTNGEALQICINERLSPIRRILYGPEADIYTPANLTDVTDQFTAYYQGEAHQEDAADSDAQPNLMFAKCFDVPDSVGTTNWIVAGSANVAFDTNDTTSTRYSLHQFKTTAAQQTIAFKSPRLLQGCPAGVYVLSMVLPADWGGVIQFSQVVNGTEANIEARKFHDTHGGTPPRISIPFWFPGGSVVYSINATISNVPNNAHCAPGLFALHRGMRPAPYTAPVDDPVAPALNVTKQAPSIYYVTDKPTSGSYRIGDRAVHTDAIPGEATAWRCVAADVNGVNPVFVGEGVLPAIAPTDLPLFAWWDPAHKHLTAGNVDTLNDQSGNARDAVQATGGKQPLWIAADATLNNKPAYRADGVDDFLQWLGVLNQPCTIFVVHYANVLAAGGSGNHDIVIDGGTATFAYVEDAAQSVVAAGAFFAGGTVPVANTPYVTTIQFNAATSFLRRNGVQLISGNAGANNAGGITIGAFRDGTRPADFTFGQVIVVSGLLDPIAIAGIEAWLRAPAQYNF